MNTPSRRDVLLATFASLRAFGESVEALAAAETVPAAAPLPNPARASVPPTSPERRVVATLRLVGTGAPAGTVRETTIFLAQGDLPNGETLTAATPGSVQADISTRWPDGSAALVLLALRDPGLGRGATGDLPLVAVPQRSAGGFDLRPFNGAMVSVAVGEEGNLSPHNLPLTPGQDRWRDGPLALSWRVDLPIRPEMVGANTMHLAVDVTLFADGSVRVVANFRNDIALRPPLRMVEGGKVSGTNRRDVAVAARYSVSVLVNNTRVASVGPVVHPLGAWLPVEARARPDGRAAPVPCWAFPNTARLHRAGLVGPYTTGGYLPAARDAYVAQMTTPGWAEPFALRGLIPNMGRTGGRPDIGMVPEPSAIVLMGTDSGMAEYVLGRSVALMGVQWHWWLTEEQAFLTPLDRPKLWLDVRDPTWLPGGQEAAKFGPDVAHQPNDHLVAYLLTGDRHRIEAMVAQACWSMMVQSQGAVSGRGTPRNLALTPEGRAARLTQLRDGDGEGFLMTRADQVRAKSWGRRGFVQCVMLAPDAMQPAPGYFRAVLAANLRWLAMKRPGWTEECGEVHGHAAPIKGDDATTFAPWQQDFGVPAEVQSVLLGLPGAMDHLRWEANWLVGSLQHDPAFCNADGVNYGILCGRPIKADGKPRLTQAELDTWDQVVGRDVPMARTWQQLGDMARAWTRYRSYGTDFEAVRVDIGGDYGLQRVIALVWMLHPGLPWAAEERRRIRAALSWLTTVAPAKIFAQPRALVRVPHKNLALPQG
ncbi:hypothetical protein [Roseomonas sp. WA12]